MLFQEGDTRRKMQDTRNCRIGNFGNQSNISW
jgi:hypothetical protein